MNPVVLHVFLFLPVPVVLVIVYFRSRIRNFVYSIYEEWKFLQEPDSDSEDDELDSDSELPALTASDLSDLDESVLDSEISNEEEFNEMMTSEEDESDTENEDAPEEDKPPPQDHADVVVEAKTLIEEEPYVAIVLNKYLSETCAKCFAWNLPGEEKVRLTRCVGCFVHFYCSAKCQREDWKDHQAECEFLRPFFGTFIPSEATRLICRMLMKAKTQPEWKAFNGRTYDSLVDHRDLLRDSKYFKQAVKDAHVEIWRLMGKESPKFDAFILAYSKAQVNRFPIYDGSPCSEIRGKAIYLGLSVHDHSCRPDAFTVFEGTKMLIRTTKKDCVYSNKITISYLDGLFFGDTSMRRGYLEYFYFFKCRCEECLDVKSDKKRLSGRPRCCPEGWFSLDHSRCSICKKNVSRSQSKRAEMCNFEIRDTTAEYEQDKMEDEPLDGDVPDWIALFKASKKILSNENTYLIGLADMIYNVTPDLQISLKYIDLCLPQMRQRPYSMNRCNFFCKRYMLLEQSKKSFQDARDALHEALETVEVVYGSKHQLTLNLRERKLDYDRIASTRNL